MLIYQRFKNYLSSTDDRLCRFCTRVTCIIRPIMRRNNACLTSKWVSETLSETRTIIGITTFLEGVSLVSLTFTFFILLET